MDASDDGTYAPGSDHFGDSRHRHSGLYRSSDRTHDIVESVPERCLRPVDSWSDIGDSAWASYIDVAFVDVSFVAIPIDFVSLDDPVSSERDQPDPSESWGYQPNIAAIEQLRS